MKNRLIYLWFLFILAALSCTEEASVRIMPEFNYKDTRIVLGKEAGASFTALIYNNTGAVSAQHETDWLQVDIQEKCIVYKALTSNEGEDARVAIVRLTSGDASISVTVRQESKDADLSLAIGQSIDDGIGMVFWVDPADNLVGKAVSVVRRSGYAFEASVMPHQALSRVNGWANTALFTTPSPNDAVAYCQSLGEGWYLPAQEELWDLFDAYNGISRNDPNFVSAVPNSLTEQEKAARAAFDLMLTTLQGDVMNAAEGTSNGESYWSSTENAAGDKAHWVRFGKSGSDAGAKTATTRFVRCMRTIGNYTYPEEPASLTIDPSTVNLEGESGSEASVVLTSNKTSFEVAMEENNWLEYSLSGMTLTFKAKSKNSTGDIRTTTVNVTAGSGASSQSVAVIVNQKASEAPSGISLSASSIDMTPDALRRSEIISITSDESEFSVHFTDPSWIQAVVDKDSKTIYFCTLSPQLGSADRITTATVTAGNGAGAPTADIIITQKGLQSSEFAVGQVIANNGSQEGGIVFWVDEANRGKAKIMALDREQMKWSTANAPGKTGIDLTGDDGYNNTQALAALPTASEIPAVGYCMAKGTGWYWGGRKDMEQLFETYNGTLLAEISPDVPGAISDYEKACRSAWDKLVQDAGGTPINTAGATENGDSYWVCRETSSGDKAFYVRYGKPVAWSSANAAKTGSRYVRAIRSVSK